MATRGRTRALSLEERKQCASTIQKLLDGKHLDPTGKRWTLRSLAEYLGGLSPEAVRKAQDPQRVGPGVARGLRDRFGVSITLPDDSPTEAIAGTIDRLRELNVPNPEGVAIYLAIEGHLSASVSDTWRARVEEVAKTLVDDGWERSEALSAVARALQEDAQRDALALYRAAVRGRKT